MCLRGHYLQPRSLGKKGAKKGDRFWAVGLAYLLQIFRQTGKKATMVMPHRRSSSVTKDVTSAY